MLNCYTLFTLLYLLTNISRWVKLVEVVCADNELFSYGNIPALGEEQGVTAKYSYNTTQPDRWKVFPASDEHVVVCQSCMSLIRLSIVRTVGQKVNRSISPIVAVKRILSDSTSLLVLSLKLLSPVISLPSYAFSTGSESLNASNARQATENGRVLVRCRRRSVRSVALYEQSDVCTSARCLLLQLFDALLRSPL